MEISYRDRKSRGQIRFTFNDMINRIPGVYNEQAEFIFRSQSIEPYDFFNLTAQARTNYLQK
jgi:hypothetical protein